MAIGFVKPHLPFSAPKRYWDMYDEKDIEFPENNKTPLKVPRDAIHSWGEMRGYTGIPSKGALTDSVAKKAITLAHHT